MTIEETAAEFRRERDRLAAEVERLRKERDEALALLREMRDRVYDWSGERASSHYRSDLFARVAAALGEGER